MARERAASVSASEASRAAEAHCPPCSMPTRPLRRSFRLLRQVRGKTHLSTAVAWREKKFKHIVFYKYFSLVLGVLKSKISQKSNDPFLKKRDFKLFHYKARVQPVSKITTIATRNRC